MALHRTSTSHAYDTKNSLYDIANREIMERRTSRLEKNLKKHILESTRESSTDSHGEPDHNHEMESLHRFGTHMEDVLHNEAVDNHGKSRETRRTEMGSVTRDRRHKSVGPGVNANRKLTALKSDTNDDSALMDLNERVQLRLRERIKTAEDTYD